MEIWPNEVCDIIQHVIDKSLGSIVILTHHELYAISSDTCQYLKDNITTRKVPIPATALTNAFEEVEEDNAPTETFLQSTSLPSNLIVGKSIVELRVIPLKPWSPNPFRADYGNAISKQVLQYYNGPLTKSSSYHWKLRLLPSDTGY